MSLSQGFKMYASLGALLSVLFFQNCQKYSEDSNVSKFLSRIESKKEFELRRLAPKTYEPAPSVMCHQWVTGNDEKGVPTWGPLIGNCSSQQVPILMSVTHENDCNTHLPCKGYPVDWNYRDYISSYMSDYYPNDIGKWLKYSALQDKNGNSIEMALDTINYRDYITPTGRPVSNGYLFFGLAGLHLNNSVTLQDDVWIEFDYRIIMSQQSDPQKSGHRLTLGVSLDWAEANRTNRSHFFEINLFKTPGFHSEHFNANLCPKDASYDHCFYDPGGRWAEGKYVSSELGLGFSTPTADNQWRSVRINIFQLIRKFQWFHPPSDWSQAKTHGFYLGIESRNSTHLYIGLRNMNLYKGAAQVASIVVPVANPVTPVTPTVISSLPTSTDSIAMNGTTHPVGLFRDGTGGFRSDGLSYCSFRSGAELFASGYSQTDYETARMISRSQIALPFKGNCIDALFMGLVRQQNAGLIRHSQGHCLLKSGAQMNSCGFRQQDYDKAPQVSLGNVYSYPSCQCK